MAKHDIELIATQGVFAGLAKQNMLFHQCIAELVDNSIASKRDDTKFNVEVILHKKENDIVEIYIVDNSKGMNIDKLKIALQLGGIPDDEADRLHEHGFGLKNALATLTRGNGYWKLWTKSIENDSVCSVEGPFGPTMIIDDDDAFPDKTFLPADISTLILVETNLSYIRTVQGRGGPTKDLGRLRQWLVEHLGVFYRGYLQQNPDTLEIDGAIWVTIEKDRKRVPPVLLPLGNKQTEYFEIEINGKIVKLEYDFGTLDIVKRDKLVSNDKALYYYQKNIPTQGVDIRIGKRVIATAQLDSIWKTTDKKSQLNRHNNYNEFIGELKIPNLGRGVLSTVNNKTDFNLDDPDWQKIFDTLSDFPPPRKIREKSEKSIQDKWVKMLKATNPDDTVTAESHVWPTGVRIDVYRKTKFDEVIIYELKVGSAQPIHIYQVKMYWDGLELKGEKIKEAVILVEDYTDLIQDMINIINSKLKTPNGHEYNIKIEKHIDKGL